MEGSNTQADFDVTTLALLRDANWQRQRKLITQRLQSLAGSTSATMLTANSLRLLQIPHSLTQRQHEHATIHRTRR